MQRRQTSLPHRWLVADNRLGADMWQLLRKLPRGSGVLVLYRDLPKGDRARLLAKIRRIARSRGLVAVDEAARQAVRVHNPKEFLRAGMAGTRLLFLSPVFGTRSHPDWKPLRRARIPALLRLSRMPIIALGGMNERRFKRVERLGFSGWAAIDAWVEALSTLKSRDQAPKS